ncbi:hypothetical protein N665_0593s0030 [Sinapis alba]|nr:hypothetical protein N665_0593s0030 [Sinapis alba]
MIRIKLPTHKHSLYPSPWVNRCDGCPWRGGYCKDGYRCYECVLFFHKACAETALQIHHPSHREHPLSLVFNWTGVKRSHEHQLNLIPRKISFDCDACGTAGDRSPYSCQQCDFMIHQSCTDLPEIINVNRHEHRLYRRLHLSPGSWVCGYCHQEIDWSYGAYSCSICPDYAIHSKCAIRYDVWEKLELKGIPEETQEIEPFKVIDENLICHFSHEEHFLQLNEESIVVSRGSIRCEACVLPIYHHQAFYSCVQCNFILHKTCANLARKKRHFYHDKPLTLICVGGLDCCCRMCGKFVEGFTYTDFQFLSIDVKCGTLSESIIHESHPCTLYYNKMKSRKCASCNHSGYGLFSCDDCSFAIDIKCVVLPKTTQHWYDEHLLFLCYEKNKRGEYWCDICEEQIDTMTWLYTCDDCCVTFHTKCVLGDFSRFMPGQIVTFGMWTIKVMQTSPGFLPRCYICHTQRALPFVLKVFYPQKVVFFCSLECLFSTRDDLYQMHKSIFN